jgi:Ca2+-binding EF-hand superfamily protein
VKTFRQALPTLALLAAAVAAQAPKPQEPDERVVRGVVTETQSRNLFVGCDADGDDRLDVLEAGAALGSVRGARDLDGFAQFDRDRDGFVDWPEFHRAMQTTLDRGAAFRVRPLRPRAPRQPEPATATPQQLLLRLYDGDADGGIDQMEFARFVRDAGLPPLLMLTNPLAQLDRNRDGKLDADELAPALLGLPIVDPKKDPRTTSMRLPAPWGEADDDRDGAIDAAELGKALKRVDPRMATWAAEILRGADANRDGKLQGDELTPPAPASGPAPARGA